MTRMTGHGGTSLTDGFLGSSSTCQTILREPMILANQAKCPRWTFCIEVIRAGAPEAGRRKVEGSLLAGQTMVGGDGAAGRKCGRPTWPAGS